MKTIAGIMVMSLYQAAHLLASHNGGIFLDPRPSSSLILLTGTIIPIGPINSLYAFYYMLKIPYCIKLYLTTANAVCRVCLCFIL